MSLFVKNSGYSGTTPFAGKEPGSKGLTVDAQGRLACVATAIDKSGGWKQTE